MNSHKLVILTFICFSCLGLPIGHESGFLGNTTSRPGDIGAALVFPSATAFTKYDDIKIYFGLIYTRQEIGSIGDSELEGTGSSFESQFIPYFTGFAGELFGLTFTNFVTYSGTNNGQFDLNIPSISGGGKANVQFEETVLGISVAKKYERFSLGASFSLEIQGSKTFSTFEGVSGGNTFLQTTNNITKFIIINSIISASYKEERHFFSAGLDFPGIKYSSSSRTETFLLEDGSGDVIRLKSENKPDYKSNTSLNLGYSYLSANWAPSVDLFYDLKNIDINISRNEDRNRANFSDDVLIKFGLRSPELKLPTNRVFKGSTYSYLFGLQYRQIDTVNESTDEENTGRTYQFSFGFKLANRKTSPIFGVYYEDEKSTSNSGSKVFGLMYSSNYNIFD
ncbi:MULTISPECIES: hypothetical protein [unclassified Halobacteriovorax]|uniref:hypothetical protein n=1 Tax=unclassified Halobacteriovorax TaxID=2639665 RepID=UPI000EA352A7|nr:hypothetical protein [Halobacteriovorax sp. BALOs_7]